MSKPDGARILVVDDHAEMGRLLGEQLGDAGHQVEFVTGGKEALRRCRAELPDLVITDLRMKEVDGLDVLAGVHALDPDLPVIVMTAFGAIDSAVQAIKRGAYHYLTKPFEAAELILYVDRALADQRARAETALLRRELERRNGLAALVGSSAPMITLQELIRKAAPSPAPVLITGESGAGKELVARALHSASPRRRRPFIPVSCSALEEQRLHGDLFGHVQGAFPAATEARRGLFVEADGGTLLLDEIGDMSPALQAKLLRVIEDGEVRPLGADTIRRVNVRILASTHQDLQRRVEEGTFRRDLLFRLLVLHVAVPPLREHRADIPELVEHFLARARARNPAARARRFSGEALSRLATHSWPGNVRELENLVERLAILSASEEVSAEALEVLATAASPAPFDPRRDVVLPLRKLEEEYIAWVVARCGGNRTRAAELLGIDTSTIYRREKERGEPR